MDSKNYTDVNARTIDGWVESGWEWGVPLSHGEFMRARSGDWRIFLTPCRAVPKEWFSPFLRYEELNNVKILGLAAGGGQQMPVMAALNARCTVLDYSDKQLEGDKAVSEREHYPIAIVKADMTKPLPFADGSFDMILHPVSNCYIEDVFPLWQECFRVLKKGGVLLAGMDNGFNFLFDDAENVPELVVKNPLPYNPLKDAALYQKSVEAGSGVQFSHTMEEQIGGQLKAGFTLTDLYEDRDASGLIAQYCPQYIATRAVKPSRRG